MKTFLRIVGAAFCGAGLFGLGIILATIIYPTTDPPDWYAYALIIIPSLVFIFLFFRSIGPRKAPEKDKVHLVAIRPRGPSLIAQSRIAHTRSSRPSPRTTDKPFFSGHFYHMSGLNFPPETKCKVSYWSDHLSFSAMNQTFALAHSKVRSVTKTTKKAIQQQYVSSIGGAVAGAALFGPLGAIIGGSAKQKTVRNYSRYLIFAYGDPGKDTKYIILSLTDWGSDGRKFISAYKKQLRGTGTQIDL